jgi:hypothetical protein
LPRAYWLSGKARLLEKHYTSYEGVNFLRFPEIIQISDNGIFVNPGLAI